MAVPKLFVGTMADDYQEYMDFDEEPQSRTDYSRLSMTGVINQQQQHGHFRSAIPIMPVTLAVFCCLMNFLIPGSGTFLAGLSVLCCSDSRGRSKWNCIRTNMMAAFLQLISSPILIGFVWSLIWGVMFIQIARKWFISDLDHRADFLACCPCSHW